MILEKEHLYHIYNQGNNRQRIFFNRDNYLYFLTKVNSYMLPYVNMIAWCLMPNHFHFMVEVKEVQLELNASEFASSENFNPSEALKKDSTANSQGFGALNIQPKFRTLNDSIGIMLRAYTRAINIQENRSGSLFRNPTKAECITKLDGITPTFFNTAHGAVLNVRMPEKEYPPVCWNYIHNNPVVANMVKKPEEWEFSSYRDYYGFRNGKMINKERAGELGLFYY